MRTRFLSLPGLDQGICGGHWHIQYRVPARNLSCFAKTNSMDSSLSCSDVVRVCHPEGPGMTGFFLSHVFHPLEKNIVWTFLSCIVLIHPLVEVVQHQAVTHFCLGYSMRLPRARWTAPERSPVLLPYKRHIHLHITSLLSQPAGNTSRPRKGMDERAEQTGMGKAAIRMCYQGPLPGGAILASWSFPALK